MKHFFKSSFVVNDSHIRNFLTLVTSVNGLTLALMLGLASPIAQATPTLVATIYGQYDTSGIGSLPSAVTSGLNWYGNSSVYDTPTLFFVNPTGYNISNAQMVLSVSTAVNNGQNTLNNGLSQTVNLGTISNTGVTQVNWGNAGPLFSYDYDDMYSSNYGKGIAGNSGSSAECSLNISQPQWFNFCAPTGNFKVSFTGTLSGTGALNGQSVAAVFGEVNVNGQYVGWQGLDPNGWSENATYDVHTGSVSGVLANIYIGTTGTVPTSPVPEPSEYALMASGLGLLGFIATRRSKVAKAA